MDHDEVRELFRTAMAEDDSAAMRQGVELLLGITGGQGLSAEDEHALRHPDFELWMPQSDERVRSRDAMRELQRAFPAAPPSVTLRGVSGAGRTWVLEGVNDYGDDDIWHVVDIIELDGDASILREARYSPGRGCSGVASGLTPAQS